MPRGKSAAHAIPPYDKVVRALGDEPWDVAVDAPLPEGLEDTGEHRKIARKVRRYKADFPAFAAEVLKIRTKSGKLIPFKLKKAQLHVWEEHIKPAFLANLSLLIYLLKGRQIGFSTLTQAVQYWRMSLWPYLGGLTAAHSTASANHIYGMLRLFYRNAPADFRPMQKHSNRHELFFAHKSDEGESGLESRIVVATAADEDLGAGYTLQMVHLSEFARYDQRAKDVDQIMATMLQAVPDDMFSMVVAETTGEGDNFAADFWRRGTFTNVFIPWVADERYTQHTPIPANEWSADPNSEWGDEVTAAGYVKDHLKEWWPDIADDPVALEHEIGCRMHWRRRTLKNKCNGKIHLFHKQYPLTPEEAFSGGGKSIFDTARLSVRLAAIRDNIPLTYRWTPGANEKNFTFSEAGELRLFYEPEYQEVYVIGVDVAIGHEDGDYSVAQVFKVGQGAQVGQLTQVATWQGHLNPSRFGELLVDLAYYYNGAFLVPESTGAGAALIEKLKDLEYNHTFIRKAQDVMEQNKYLEKWGFHTSPHTKNLLVDSTQDAILTGRIIFNDAETLREMLAYTADERGRLTAPKGKHDDLVIGTCLAVYGSIDMKVSASTRRTVDPEVAEFEAFLRGETPRSSSNNYRPTVM